MRTMRAALTVWDERISPLFDVSREAVILSAKDGILVERRTERIDAPTAALKVARLLELGVNTLVCGAISEPLQRELTSRGIRVFGFVAGELGQVERALVAGALPTPALSMPGCHCPRSRLHGGRSRRCERRRRPRRQSAAEKRREDEMPRENRTSFGERTVKIAISAEGPSLDAAVDPRFGRCAYFIVVETASGRFEAVQNGGGSRTGGAGIQSAQLLAQQGIQAVLTGNCGPNAYQTLEAAGIQVVVGCVGSVSEAVRRFVAGELRPAAAPNVASHAGKAGEGR
jgi:predicted Fe-Mo cluster-binding NifX family protein